MLEFEIYLDDCTYKGQVTLLWESNLDSTIRVRADSNRRVQHSHFGDKELTLFQESVDPAIVLCV